MDQVVLQIVMMGSVFIAGYFSYPLVNSATKALKGPQKRDKKGRFIKS